MTENDGIEEKHDYHPRCTRSTVWEGCDTVGRSWGSQFLECWQKEKLRIFRHLISGNLKALFVGNGFGLSKISAQGKIWTRKTSSTKMIAS